MKTPVIREKYRDDTVLRNSFFGFIRSVFPRVNFEEWFTMGFWRDAYNPVSAVVDDTIVSNVSLAEMKLLIDGRETSAIQIGAVGTIPAYRKRGLSRMLMEYVLDTYGDTVDIVFLFANDTVLDYYPRFGFTRYDETEFISETPIPESDCTARRLNIRQTSDAAIVHDLLSRRFPITRRFGAIDYDFITWWHILNLYPEQLFYIEEDDIIFILSDDNEHLRVRDVISAQRFDMSSILAKALPRNSPRTIIYDFPPDQLPYEYDRTKPSIESPLFVRGNFVVEGGQFKFPGTAQT